jgi:uncharacterized protein YcaQ
VSRTRVEAAFWGGPPRAFEYWAHAACILPIESWPWFAAERRRRLLRPHRVPVKPLMREVRAKLVSGGPQTVSELGGGRIGSGWWNWSPTKMAVEELYNIGEVVCVERRAWKRVYDLAERAIPAELLTHDTSDEECHVHLVKLVAARLGVATERELGNYFGSPLRRTSVLAGIAGAGLVPVRVEGWSGNTWAHPDALRTLDAGGPRGRHRTTLLSPFDSLLWDRARVQKLFAFRHKLEAYVPAPKRVHGYYVMPLLTAGRLRGRVDPARAGTTLVARQLSVDPGSEGDMATALAEAATWVNCDRVAVPRVVPAESREPLLAALGDLGVS